MTEAAKIENRKCLTRVCLDQGYGKSYGKTRRVGADTSTLIRSHSHVFSKHNISNANQSVSLSLAADATTSML